MVSIETIDNPVLKEKVKELISTYPASLTVIEDLIEHYEHNTKRRKTPLIPHSPSSPPSDIVCITGFTFPSTLEKAYELAITQTHLIIRDTKTKSIDSQYDLKTLKMGICLPDPDKPQSYTFVIFHESDSTSAIVFTTSGNLTINRHGDIDVIAGSKHDTISELLEETTRVRFMQPSELNLHVKTYLKGRKGYLFFLPIGILFGFSKPVLFFPLESLDSMAVENVVLNTFDLSLTLKPEKSVIGVDKIDFIPNTDNRKITVEFYMVDRLKYDNIDHYITQHGVTNRSSPKGLMEIQMKKIAASKAIPTSDDNEDEEDDEDFEPSEDDHDPLEYDSNDEAEMEADKDLQLEEIHEYEDAEEDGDE